MKMIRWVTWLASTTAPNELLYITPAGWWRWKERAVMSRLAFEGEMRKETQPWDNVLEDGGGGEITSWTRSRVVFFRAGNPDELSLSLFIWNFNTRWQRTKCEIWNMPGPISIKDVIAKRILPHLCHLLPCCSAEGHHISWGLWNYFGERNY